MKTLKNIFARIWAIWGILSFIVTFLLIFIPSMFVHFFKDPKKGQIYFLYISRVWMKIWLKLISCPLKISGLEHFKKNENYVVLFNHNALLDVPLSAPFVPGANKTIAKASFAKIPVFGLFYKQGSVLVDRKNEQSRVRSFEAMKKVLALGMHMCIYPEGTRNRTMQPLKSFYDGAFKLAVDTKKNVIPCIIKGTKKAMPIDLPFYLLPTRLSMKFLPQVSSLGKTAKQLKVEVFNIMLDAYTAKDQKS
ncbi:MAG: lysophospholipid acyltransferase family protein [Ferruginibacter sp.]